MSRVTGTTGMAYREDQGNQSFEKTSIEGVGKRDPEKENEGE